MFDLLTSLATVQAFVAALEVLIGATAHAGIELHLAWVVLAVLPIVVTRKE